MIIHRDRFEANLPQGPLLESFRRWVDDVILSRAFLIEDGDVEEFFMTPGAYMRLSSTFEHVERSDIKDSPAGGCTVGRLCGISVRSPIFVRSSIRDLEGLADLQLEYRIIRSE